PRADLQAVRGYATQFQLQRLARGVGELDPGAFRMPAAGPVADLVAGPAQLLDASVREDPAGVVDRAEAVRVLLHDDDHCAGPELERGVQPPEALRGLVGGAGRRVGLAGRPDAPGAVPGAAELARGDRELPAADLQLAAPAAHLAEPGC